MKTNVQALKDLYVALGGEAADVADMSTSVEVLNAISAKYSGADDAVLNPDAIDNIAAVAGDIGGGGSGDSTFSTAQVTVINNLSDQVIVYIPCYFPAEDDYPEVFLSMIQVPGNEQKTVTAIIPASGETYVNGVDNYVVEYTGNISNGAITGDGTITITDIY